MNAPLHADARRRPVPASVWLLVVVALCLRLAYVLAYPQYPALVGDDDMYDDVAWNLASGVGFSGGVGGLSISGPPRPEIAIGPVYPAFLAAAYVVGGHSLTAARVAQAGLGAIMVLLCYFLGRDVFDDAVGQLAAALVAFNPPFIIYTGMLLSETAFALIIVLAIWLIIRALRARTPRLWAFAGFAAAAGVLLREETLAIVFVAAAALWVCGAWRGRVAHLSVFVGVLALTVAAWTVRNYLTFGEFILVSANGGQTLYLSTTGWAEWQKAEDPGYQAIAGGMTYLQASHALSRAALRSIAADPMRYASLCVQRVVPFWVGSHTTYLRGVSESFGAYSGRGAWMRVAFKLAFLALHLGLLVLAAAGIWLAFANRGDRPIELLLLLAPVAGIATVHFFLFSTSRYQVPTMPFLLVFGAVGLRSAWRGAAPAWSAA